MATQAGWFGWRVVRKNGIGHAFKGPERSLDDWEIDPEPGERSLCGKVGFGPTRKTRAYRPCATCATIWASKYPKKEV